LYPSGRRKAQAPKTDFRPKSAPLTRHAAVSVVAHPASPREGGVTEQGVTWCKTLMRVERRCAIVTSLYVSGLRAGRCSGLSSTLLPDPSPLTST
jgi:hypothetical protein